MSFLISSKSIILIEILEEIERVFAIYKDKKKKKKKKTRMYHWKDLLNSRNSMRNLNSPKSLKNYDWLLCGWINSSINSMCSEEKEVLAGNGKA
jgi:hypothetical protein